MLRAEKAGFEDDKRKQGPFKTKELFFGSVSQVGGRRHICHKTICESYGLWSSSFLFLHPETLSLINF